MIEEASQFLIDLNAEYLKDIEISKNRFKEFEELDNISILRNLYLINFIKKAEFSEVVEMYKIDLENELEAIKNDFEIKKEIGLKNIKKKFTELNRDTKRAK